MAKFQISTDGSKMIVTEKKYRCKNSSCKQTDHMRRLLTSLTPSGTCSPQTIFSVDHPSKDTVRFTREYEHEYEVTNYDANNNLVDSGLIQEEGTEYYAWDFVKCDHCNKNYVIETSYDTIHSFEVEERLFPLF